MTGPRVEPRTGSRRQLGPPVVGLIGTVVVIGILVFQSVTSTGPWFGDTPRGDRSTAVTQDDGALPDTATVFDDQYPGVANLDPQLLHALREAATDANDDSVKFVVNSGWRSPAYQNQLLREAVSKYGSAKEAARWVATADTSPHVSGNAVDIGHSGAKWLAEHGARYGLCQVYRNEPWHYELRPRAVDHGCPTRYADPTEDPRMQQ